MKKKSKQREGKYDAQWYTLFAGCHFTVSTSLRRLAHATHRRTEKRGPGPQSSAWETGDIYLSDSSPSPTSQGQCGLQGDNPTHFPVRHLAPWWLFRKPDPEVPHPVTWCHIQIHKQRGDLTQVRCQPREKERNCGGHLRNPNFVSQDTHQLLGVNKNRRNSKR